MKNIVLPGELVATENKKNLGGVYKKENKLYSQYLGIVYDGDLGIKVVPMNGKYIPKVGDVIVGQIVSDDPFTYMLDVNSYTRCVLSKRDLENVLLVNDVVLLRVVDVNEIKEMSVELVSKLFKGSLNFINPKKVARVVGKSKSMQEVIEKYTGTKITVGANGYIYVIGQNLMLVKSTLEKIDQYSHVENLTIKIEDYLKKETSKS